MLLIEVRKSGQILFGEFRNQRVLSEEGYNELTSMCIQCGAEGKKGLEYIEDELEERVWRSWYECRSCGTRVECLVCDNQIARGFWGEDTKKLKV